jgi:hypothetical protein
MVCQPVRFALLIGALAAAVSPARAHGPSDCGAPCSAPCGPTTRTIRVTECVPETYTVKRTVYKVECRTKEMDSFRCETVQVQKERVVSCVKRVPIVKEECRKVCRNVTTYEDREVCKKVWRNVEECVMKKKLVRLGHWECEEVPARRGLFGHGGGGHGHRNGCNDACADPCADQCADQCPETRTRKRWVCCPEWECCPVKVCKKVCVEEKQICKVPVCRQVVTEEKVKVCTYECRTEQRTEKYTACETRRVPCKVTVTERVCVPHVEDVTCTRMVARCVERQVPCDNVCEDSCRPSLRDRLHSLCNRDRGCDDGCGRGHGRGHGDCCR